MRHLSWLYHVFIKESCLLEHCIRTGGKNTMKHTQSYWIDYTIINNKIYFHQSPAFYWYRVWTLAIHISLISSLLTTIKITYPKTVSFHTLAFSKHYSHFIGWNSGKQINFEFWSIPAAQDKPDFCLGWNNGKLPVVYITSKPSSCRVYSNCKGWRLKKVQLFTCS